MANKRALSHECDFIPVASAGEPREGCEGRAKGEKGLLGTQFKYKLNDSPGCLSATRFVEISSMEIRFARTNCRAARRGVTRLVAWLLFTSHIADTVGNSVERFRGLFFQYAVFFFKLCRITLTNVL